VRTALSFWMSCLFRALASLSILDLPVEVVLATLRSPFAGLRCGVIRFLPWAICLRDCFFGGSTKTPKRLARRIAHRSWGGGESGDFLQHAACEALLEQDWATELQFRRPTLICFEAGRRSKIQSSVEAPWAETANGCLVLISEEPPPRGTNAS
jgi:hypothetical protein